jgi:hypothetical protein
MGDNKVVINKKCYWMKYFSYAVLALFILALGVSFILPSDYFVERSIQIKAPKNKIIYQIVNLNEWEDWNPWHETDPKAKISYEGPTGAVGSRMRWEGPEMGIGEIEIVAIKPDQEVSYRFVIQEPRRLIGQGRINISSVGDEFLVRWTMFGPLDSPFERLVGILMEQKLGSDFNRGLRNLKGFVELEKNPFEQSPPGSLLKAEQPKLPDDELNAEDSEVTKTVEQPVKKITPEPTVEVEEKDYSDSQNSALQKLENLKQQQDSANEDKPTPTESNLEGGLSSEPEETIATPMESESAESVEAPTKSTSEEESSRIPSGQIDYE